MVGINGRVELSDVSCKDWDCGGMERARHVAIKAKRGRVWGVIAEGCLVVDFEWGGGVVIPWAHTRICGNWHPLLCSCRQNASS